MTNVIDDCFDVTLPFFGTHHKFSFFGVVYISRNPTATLNVKKGEK